MDRLIKLFDSESKRISSLYTKEIDFQTTGINKRIRRIKVDYTGTAPIMYYRVDNDNTWVSVSINSVINLKVMKLQLKISLASDTKISSISIVYRKMRLA